MCGDADGPRRWTGRDQALARQIAMEGALIVDSARLGGDEFAVLLTGDPDHASAVAAAGRLHARLCEPYELEDRPVRVGASIGVAMLPGDGTDLPALMRSADAAMYRAKRAGGGVRS